WRARGGRNRMSCVVPHPPRVADKGSKVWTVGELRTFLQRARSDRFFALWVLEATSGMLRCELAGARRELLDLDTGKLTLDVTRGVVDGHVGRADGQTQKPPRAVPPRRLT